MLHSIRRTTWVASLLAVAIQGDAFAATVDVTITDFVFTPGNVTVALGDSVRWTNNGPSPHTATGFTLVSLFDSGVLSPGDDFTFAFTTAGVFTYHCELHPVMTGRVRVRPSGAPAAGPDGTPFRVQVASAPAAPGFVYDVQKKNPGGEFRDWMIGITSNIATFDSTGVPSGTYEFRSRLRRVAIGAASDYSPAVSIAVTP